MDENITPWRPGLIWPWNPVNEVIAYQQPPAQNNAPSWNAPLNAPDLPREHPVNRINPRGAGPTPTIIETRGV